MGEAVVTEPDAPLRVRGIASPPVGAAAEAGPGFTGFRASERVRAGRGMRSLIEVAK